MPPLAMPPELVPPVAAWIGVPPVPRPPAGLPVPALQL